MIDFSKYNGHQVILTTDRLIFNSRKDDIFLLAKTTVGISAGNSVHINVGDKNNPSDDCKFIVNSPKIYLGLINSTTEPICKANMTATIFNDIIDVLKVFSIKLQTAVGQGSGVVKLTQINSAANELNGRLSTISKNIENIKSKISFTN